MKKTLILFIASVSLSGCLNLLDDAQAEKDKKEAKKALTSLAVGNAVIQNQFNPCSPSYWDSSLYSGVINIPWGNGRLCAGVYNSTVGAVYDSSGSIVTSPITSVKPIICKAYSYSSYDFYPALYYWYRLSKTDSSKADLAFKHTVTGSISSPVFDTYSSYSKGDTLYCCSVIVDTGACTKLEVK